MTSLSSNSFELTCIPGAYSRAQSRASSSASHSGTAPPQTPATNDRRLAPVVAYKVRGQLDFSELDDGQRQILAADLDADMLTRGTAIARASCRRTWSILHWRWFVPRDSIDASTDLCHGCADGSLWLPYLPQFLGSDEGHACRAPPLVRRPRTMSRALHYVHTTGHRPCTTMPRNAHRLHRDARTGLSSGSSRRTHRCLPVGHSLLLSFSTRCGGGVRASQFAYPRPRCED